MTNSVRRALFLLTAVVMHMGCAAGPDGAWAPAPRPERPEVVRYADVEWGDLNPARGDASPRAGDLWGDRAAGGATGFLVRFANGFSSPPHIHNVTYRGVVIGGEVHNDDAGAAPMWMPAGSFWTQPAGEPHVTAARGARTLAYIEIDDGPYLVRPQERAYDTGERALNTHASNVVWVEAPGATGSGARVAFLWESADARGSFLRLPPGFEGSIEHAGEVFRAVVIDGGVVVHGADDPRALEPGGYFGGADRALRRAALSSPTETVLYLRTDAGFRVRSSSTNESAHR